jgi:hypothetical protein
MHFLIFFCCTLDWVNISEYNYQRSLHIWTLHCCGCWFGWYIKECLWRKHLLYLELIQNNWTISSFIIAMRCILMFEFVQNNYNARSGFTSAKKEAGWFQICWKGGGMILWLLKGKGMILGLFEKKQDAIPPHLKHWVPGQVELQHVGWLLPDIGKGCPRGEIHMINH